MVRSNKLRIFALMCFAYVGLIAGHQLTYLLLAPDSGHRLSLLERTGHGYLDAAISAVGPLAFMALLFVVLMGSLQARAGTRPALWRCALLMATVQVTGFGLQEIMERTVSGAALADVSSVLLVGLVVQLAVAALATLLFVSLHRAGELLSRITRSRRFARSANNLPRPHLRLRFATADPYGVLRSRGPPALL